MRALLIAATLTATLATGCARDGSLLIVEVSADAPITTDTIAATIAADGSTKDFAVPVAGGTLTSLFFEVELPPSATSAVVTLTAGGEQVMGSVQITPGKVVTLLLRFDTGPSDLGDASAVADGGDASTAVAVCGNGKREGLEGCDDGNTNDGDGCTHDCVVETNNVATFTDIGSTTVASMTVAMNRHIFIRRTGACSGGTAPDQIDRVVLDGGVAPDFLSNVMTNCGGSIDAFGNQIVWGGTGGGTLYVQRYSGAASGQMGVVVESFAEPANWTAFAAETQSTGFYFSSASQANKGTEVVDPAGTMLVPFSTTPSSCSNLLFDQTTPTPTLLCSVATSVFRSDVSPDGGSDFMSIANFMANQIEPAAAISDLVVDAEGTIYVAVVVGSNASSAGAVQAFNPMYTPSKARFFDSSLPVRALAYDATTNDLLVLTGSALKRVSLERHL